MNNRTDYEHEELDTDHNYYWFTNSDVDSPYKNPKLKDFVEWWNKEEAKIGGLFYKWTRFYFTFEGIKYYLRWTFYSSDFLNKAIEKAKSIGCTNIQLNYGVLD